MKENIAIECTINGERIYGSYSNNTVFLKSNKEMLETVKAQLKHAIEYLEKYLSNYVNPDIPEKG
jgi:hypothetical protein